MTKTDLGRHWFFLVLPLVLALDLAILHSSRGSVDVLIEAGLLFDLAFVLPCLYWLCYRRRGRPAVLRAIAIGCLGIWALSSLIPESEQDLLRVVAPLRILGLAILVAFEVALVLAVYRRVFQGESTAQTLAQAPTDLPRWLVRLLTLEAALWLRLWRFIKRIVGRD